MLGLSLLLFSLPLQTLAGPGVRRAVEYWKPTTNQSFVYALEDPSIPTGAVKATIYDVDLFDTSKATIARYHKEGKKVVCYFSAGSYEDWRPDASSFTPACYCNASNKCKMDGWHGEFWFDWKTPSCVTNLKNVMTKRLQLAKSKGCDAVDPDNVDSYSNKSGWKTTAADQVAMLLWFSQIAHANGLGIGLKNAGGLVKQYPTLVPAYDFSVTEQCLEYEECSSYYAFTSAKKSVFNMEYEEKISCSGLPAGFSMLQYDASYDLTYKKLKGSCSN